MIRAGGHGSGRSPHLAPLGDSVRLRTKWRSRRSARTHKGSDLKIRVRVERTSVSHACVAVEHERCELIDCLGASVHR